MNRRRFLGAAAAASMLYQATGFPATSMDARRTGHNLVPEEPSTAPNYWCTWAAQNYMYGQDLAKLDPQVLEGNSGSMIAREAMTEEALFGAGGWVNDFYPRVRSDLFFLLDDGWESGGTSTFELNTKKFPSFTGSSGERLTELNRAVRRLGWRGAGLWCRNTPGGDADYRLESLSAAAQIKYWKVDIGDPAFNLVRLRDASRFPLTFEHVNGELPVNGNWRIDGRFGAQPPGSLRIEILKHTDVYRTYDVTSILSLPTTLDRAAAMLKGTEGDPRTRSLLNVEDEVYVAAALGCTMGVMRHPLTGLRPGPDADLFFNGPRQPKKRIDEVVRALRWQRIAPPFSPGSGRVEVSNEILTDVWRFERGQTWMTGIIAETVRQGAPAAITRNLPLPDVKANGEKSFVFAARFPNGAVAIAAQERTRADDAWFMPPCDVTLSVSDAPGPFGIFGGFNSLTLISEGRFECRRVLAQDLAGEEAFDISHLVRIAGNRLCLPGAVIRQIGLSDGTKGDLSSAGMVLALSS